ncbi:hypothetical protein MRS60_07830 [Burkholderia pyrrocinia]|uniref:hypothetical protein n=1 Tax=Burkholderia pyrrocinia TaxID=60550 RepID=UPI001FB1CC5D|nr:hypothetical protein [Burkholderia pyrrocinia]UOB56998.1 hypothetical protein MRS60_07830 [Burkholderia pyrrocinia]
MIGYVELVVDDQTYAAEYHVVDGLMTVYTDAGGAKSTGVNGMNEQNLARLLLGHLVREGKASARPSQD